MINIPKGTKDILPSESYKWHTVRKVIEKLSNRYNLKEISTPIFEHTELFIRGVGESSDIVNKEMYTFLDKSERSLTLKPEGTSPAVRSFIENGLFNETLPLKAYYITPCFRYERPQAGRLRQHTQFGVEIFGPDSEIADVEALSIMRDFYVSFGINPTFKINSLGCKACNDKYKDAIRKFVAGKLDKFCPDCQRRYLQNPLRILDCKVDSCKAELVNAPKLSDIYCESCMNRLQKTKDLLESLNINYIVDTNLVRGLDYYTGLVYEVVDIDKELGQNALGAGGRYNNLVEELGGKSTSVVGFGIGIERLLLYLENKKIQIENNEKVDIYIASITDNSAFILNLVKRLRELNLSVEHDLMDRSLKAQFKYADKLEAHYVITVGDDEIANNELMLKDMKSSTQEKITIDKLIQRFSKNV